MSNLINLEMMRPGSQVTRTLQYRKLNQSLVVLKEHPVRGNYRARLVLNHSEDNTSVGSTEAFVMTIVYEQMQVKNI